MKMEEERDGENTDRTGMFKTKHRKTKNWKKVEQRDREKNKNDRNV